MDWDLLINVISDLIKDDTTRYEVYKRFIEAAEYSDRELISESLGQDSAFDEVWDDYFAEEDDTVDFVSDEDADYEYND